MLRLDDHAATNRVLAAIVLPGSDLPVGDLQGSDLRPTESDTVMHNTQLNLFRAAVSSHSGNGQSSIGQSVFERFQPHRLVWICAVALFQLLIGTATRDAVAVDAVVIRPTQWAPALQTWKQYRASQGYEIVELDSNLPQPEITAKLAEIHSQSASTLKFVVLAGDVDPRIPGSIPTFYRESTAMVKFGGDKRIATDNPYGDFDGDDLPDVAVARIPADSAEQLKTYLDRVITHETNRDFSNWRRDVHIVAGVGGFGPVADSMIEMTTRRFLADRIPGWSKLSMTQASLGSHYCPDPFRFSETCISRLNQGGMFWVYIGHGHVKTLDYVRAGEEYLPILNSDHLPLIRSQHPPIAVFLACYTGAYDATEDSLAEELLMRDQGPVAALAATRVSGPYGLAMLSDGLLDQLFQIRTPTLGEIVLASKRSMLEETVESTPARLTGSSGASANPPVADPAKAGQMRMITAIAGALSPKDYDLRAERLEHVWQVHLLGDPMLRVDLPQELELEVPKSVAPGETVSVAGISQSPGELLVEFGYRRQTRRRELDDLPVDLQTQAGRDAFQQRYADANQRVLLQDQMTLIGGPFQSKLPIPADLRDGKYCVRVFIEGQEQCQVGYAEVSVRTPR